MKSDSPLKKHHFWFLLGVVPLLTLIGVLTVSSRVGGEIAKRKADIKAANDKIGPKMNPKPDALIKAAEKVVVQVSNRQGGLHEENWIRQKHLYTWPSNSKLLREIEYGEANIDRTAEQLHDLRVQRLLVPIVAPAERAAAYKKAQDAWTKLPPAARVADVRDYLSKLGPVDRRAALEPAWPKFGDALPTDRGELEEFRARGNEVYLPEFSTLIKKDAIGPGTGMADKVAPTQFRGGWESVLRHVNNWGPVQLTKDQVWLIMEDIWIQRSLLEGVRSVNEESATFRRAKRDKDGNVTLDPWFDEQGNKLDKDGKRTATPDEEKTKALFRNRTWGLDLELVKDGNDLYLGGTLTNLTDRLQLMGTNNTMLLKVWFSKDAAAQPMIFRVGGEFLPGVGSKKTVRVDMRDQVVDGNVLPIVRVPDLHRVPATLNAVEIVRVEQVFDVRTVPIKQINALVLGKLDSRYAALQLVTPSFIKETAPTPPPETGGAGPGGMGPGGPPPGMGGAPPMPGAGGGGQPATKGKAYGGGSVAEVIDGNRKRYLPDPSLLPGQLPSVRRMPVAIVVVVDQAYMQDVQLALANSPLRFQITQVTWRRYRGDLAGTGTGGATTNPGSDIDFGMGNNNITGSGDPDSRPGGRPPGVGGPPPKSGGPGPMGGPPPMPGAGPGPLGGPGGSPGSSGSASTVSESQITSGLVELSIYGIVSLYEKFDAPKADGTTPAPLPNPNPQQPVPMGMPPMGTPPKTRRARAHR